MRFRTTWKQTQKSICPLTDRYIIHHVNRLNWTILKKRRHAGMQMNYNFTEVVVLDFIGSNLEQRRVENSFQSGWFVVRWGRLVLDCGKKFHSWTLEFWFFGTYMHLLWTNAFDLSHRGCWNDLDKHTCSPPQTGNCFRHGCLAAAAQHRTFDRFHQELQGKAKNSHIVKHW